MVFCFYVTFLLLPINNFLGKYAKQGPNVYEEVRCEKAHRFKMCALAGGIAGILHLAFILQSFGLENPFGFLESYFKIFFHPYFTNALFLGPLTFLVMFMFIVCFFR